MDDSEDYFPDGADDQAGYEPETGRLVDPFFAQFQQLPRQRNGRRVIRRDAFADVFAAERAVKEAQAQVDELEEQVARAIGDAKHEGLSIGRHEAAEEYAVQLGRVERRVAEFYQSAEGTIAELGVKVAEMILGPLEFPAAPQMAARRVITAHLNRQPHLIHVAPDAERYISDVLDIMRQEHTSAKLPTVKVDKRLPSGRAVLVTRFGSVDLDLASQLRAIRETLRQGNEPRGNIPEKPQKTARRD